jgi:hypothetical protein
MTRLETIVPPALLLNTPFLFRRGLVIVGRLDEREELSLLGRRDRAVILVLILILIVFALVKAPNRLVAFCERCFIPPSFLKHATLALKNTALAPAIAVVVDTWDKRRTGRRAAGRIVGAVEIGHGQAHCKGRARPRISVRIPRY